MEYMLKMMQGDVGVNIPEDSIYKNFFEKFGMKTSKKLYHLAK
jgi:hypothetical protein